MRASTVTHEVARSPDIVHQCLLALLDSPLAKAGRLQVGRERAHVNAAHTVDRSSSTRSVMY